MRPRAAANGSRGAAALLIKGHLLSVDRQLFPVWRQLPSRLAIGKGAGENGGKSREGFGKRFPKGTLPKDQKSCREIRTPFPDRGELVRYEARHIRKLASPGHLDRPGPGVLWRDLQAFLSKLLISSQPAFLKLCLFVHRWKAALRAEFCFATDLAAPTRTHRPLSILESLHPLFHAKQEAHSARGALASTASAQILAECKVARIARLFPSTSPCHGKWPPRTLV